MNVIGHQQFSKAGYSRKHHCAFTPLCSRASRGPNICPHSSCTLPHRDCDTNHAYNLSPHIGPLSLTLLHVTRRTSLSHFLPSLAWVSCSLPAFIPYRFFFPSLLHRRGAYRVFFLSNYYARQLPWCNHLISSIYSTTGVPLIASSVLTNRS